MTAPLDLDAELDFALRLADVADRLTMAAFRTPVVVSAKADGSPLTHVDLDVDRALTSLIAAERPGHRLVSEEGDTHWEASGDSRPTWIIDPLDGTRNYAWGIPVWASLIALAVDGSAVAGVASFPALGERYSARRGGGARRNGLPIRVSVTARLGEARLAHSSRAVFARHGLVEPFDTLLERVQASRGLGPNWGQMLVAAGHLDAVVEPSVHAWDVAAMSVIVEEAGGRFTDLGGGHGLRDIGSLLVSNGSLHGQIVAVFEDALKTKERK